MKGKIIAIGIAVLLTFLVFTGCFGNSNNENDTNTRGSNHITVTMNASEFHEDIHDRDSGRAGVWRNYTRYYDSVDGGDTLIVIDYISDLNYQSEKDKTLITLSDPTIIFSFKGNIENSFTIGDKVKITVTIKHVELSFVLNNVSMYYDVEIYEEQWVDEQYFIENRFGMPLPTSCIEIEI